MMGWWRRRRAAEPPSPDAQAALAALLARARNLPRTAEPQRDLWLGIRNRIEHAHAAPTREPLWRIRVSLPAWAAGALALAVLGGAIGAGLWLRQPLSLDDPAAVRQIADALRERDGTSDTRRALLALLDERRGQLPPDVVAAVEKNLGEIDHAIAEIQVAFADHPDNASLRFLLAEAYHREAEILEQLEWWTHAREPGAPS